MLNLDTHILICALQGDLKPREQELLSRHRWTISAIVLWELVKLIQLGRVELEVEDPELNRVLSKVHVWPLDFEVCKKIKELDFKSDPADELIAATSLAHRVPLLTRDVKIRKSKVVPFP